MNFTRCIAGVLVVLGMVVASHGQDPTAGGSDADQAAIQQMMAKMAIPGKPHQYLQKMVGKYKAKCTWRMPGGEAVEEGTAEFRSILGGRYVIQEFHSQIQGEPMEGFGIMGYDNSAEKFVGVWLDNMSTAIHHTEGKLNEKTGVLEETGVCNSPAGKMNFKMSTKPTENGFIFSLTQVDGAMETPLGRIEYIKQ